MKAIVAEPPKRNSVRLAEIPKPVPRKGQILLRTLCVGIDGTDREINDGIYGTPPSGSPYIVLGHEAVARVQEIGDKAENFSEKDLVVPTVRRPCKENCLNCRNGETDMCLTGNYFEHGIYKLHGFASEYAVSDANFLVKVPAELEDLAVLLEPLSIAEKAVSQSFKIQERMVWEPNDAFVVGAGPLGLLVTMILRLRGLEVYAAATREKESLKAKIVSSVGGTYVNVRETPIESLEGKFDIVIEATGRVEAALQALNLLGPNGVMCFLGVYREKKACEEFGKVLTNMVLGNRLMFGSVSSNKSHFDMGIKDMFEIKRRYGNELDRLITKKLYLTDFERAFNSGREDIKNIICFK
ncbi:MAG: glucose 1-dehydrogenase [Candidatus Bathyarchaeota archaeon]|nr:glucose 1-dehydrogenase [Candidatus Bathyarchaeota archaeon]MDH5713102.1 glucose 1-dehydrogenase [Candidatus Bathyarchaeota archaeon]